MISFKTQQRLAQLIQKIAEAERKVEAVRQVLAEIYQFEPYTAFKRIDRLQNSYLTANDIERFLKENEVFINTNQLFYIVKQLDSNQDGKISYVDFCNNMLPKEDSTLKQIACSRKQHYVKYNESLQYEVEWAIARIFEQMAQNFLQIEDQKSILVNSFDFTVNAAFKTIDDINKGNINISQLYKFQLSANIQLSDEDIEAAFRVIDSDQDSFISFKEFYVAVMPQWQISSSYLTYFPYYTSPRRNKWKLYDDDDYKRSLQFSLEKSRLNKSYLEIEKKERQLEKEKQDLMRSTYYQSPLRKSYLNKSLNNFYQSPLKYSTPIKQEKEIYQSQQMKRQSPLKGNEEAHLVNGFKKQIQLDRDLEEARKRLSLRSDFNLFAGFRAFDDNNKGYISSSDLKNALNNHGLFPTQEQIFLLFRRYDKDSDGLIKFSDFCKIVTPSSQEYAKILNDRSPLYSIENEKEFPQFSLETERLFRSLFQTAINGEIEVETLRQTLNRRPMFNLHDAFSVLDLSEKGYISQKEFEELLQSYGIFSTKQELIGLVKRYNKNLDGKITYSEFISELTPKSPMKQI